MEIPDSLLEATVGLLFDSSAVVREQTAKSCNLFKGLQREKVVAAIMSAAKAKWTESLEHAEFIISVLSQMHSDVSFNADIVKECFDIVQAIFAKETSEDGAALINQVSDFALELTKSSSGTVVPLLSEVLKDNFNPRVLAFFSRCLELHLPEVESQLLAILETLSSGIKTVSDKEGRLSCMRVVDVIIGIVEGLDKYQYEESITCVLSSIMTTWMDPSTEAEVKSEVFKLAIKVISTFDVSDLLGMFRSVVPNLPTYLKETGVDRNAMICFNKVRKIADNTSALYGSDIDKQVPAMMCYIENNKEIFVDKQEKEARTSVIETLIAFEKSLTESVVPYAISCIKTNAPFAGLFVCQKMIKAGMLGGDGDAMVSAISELAQKKPHREARYALFGLYMRLCGQRIDVSLITSDVFMLISSPMMGDKINDFVKMVSKCAASSKVDRLLDMAVEPKYALAARVAFAMLAESDSDPTYSGESTTVIPRALIYASCPWFSPKARSQIIEVVGRILQIGDANVISAAVSQKKCIPCIQKEVNSFVCAAVDTCIGIDTKIQWLNSAVSFVDSFSTLSHPEAPGKPPIAISAVRSALYIVAAHLFNQNTIIEVLQATWQPIMVKFDMCAPDECLYMALALIKMRSYNATYAMELYRQKADGRAYKAKDNGNQFSLEFASRVGQVEPSLTVRMNEFLFDENIPDVCRSHALRRYIKYAQVDGIKIMKLVMKFVGSNTPLVVKPAIATMLKLVKDRKIPLDNSLTAPLRKVMLALRMPGSDSFRSLANELFFATPVVANFLNICGLLFNTTTENAMSYVDLLLELITRSDGNALKSPTSAAAVAMLLTDPAFVSKGAILARSIFQYTREPSDFALTYFVGSEQELVKQFISFLFGFLNNKEPWNKHAESIIRNLTLDSRFSNYLGHAFEQFARVSGAQGSKCDVVSLCHILFNIDQAEFVNRFVNKDTPASPELITMLASVFKEIGAALLEAGTKTRYDPSNTMHHTILRVIAAAKIPPNLELNSFIFVILVMAQTRAHVDDGYQALLNLSERYPEISSQRIKSTMNDFKTDGSEFHCLRALFSIVAKDLSMFHVTPFTKIAPIGALAGYTEIIPQGRPMIRDILQMGKAAPNAALLTIPNVKVIPPDRYGEMLIGELMTFILDNALKDAEAFNCILELFDWIPRNVLYEHAERMFDVTQKALRSTAPPQAAFSCITMFSDSLIFAGRQDFKSRLPMFIAISYAYSEGADPSMVVPARNALCSACAFCGMANTSQALRKSIGRVDGFLAANSAVLVREMDIRVLDAAFQMLEDPQTIVKINIGMLLSASLNQRVGGDRGIHFRIVTLLNSEDKKVKCGVLKAIRCFPPALM